MKWGVFIVNKVHEYLEEFRPIYFALHYSWNANRFANIVKEVFDFHEFFVKKSFS
jgi:hypothetical protein